MLRLIGSAAHRQRLFLARARRAYGRLGAAGFLRLCAENVRMLLRGEASRHSYIHDLSWDREHGVDTSGRVDVDEMSAPEHEKEGAGRYEPTPAECFTYMLDEAKLGPVESYSFVDLGSGKGRVVILAALAGFRKAIGVELGEELHAVACRNFEVMGARLKECRIVALRADARSFDFPSEPTVCFLNNSFRAGVLDTVLDNIEASLAGRPRPFTLIYYHPDHAERIERRPIWQVVSKGRWRDSSHPFAIYRWRGG